MGSPLKGLQVLGLMESRGLSFDNVFVLSMSDSIVPNIAEVSPLIPKDISNSLGIGYVGRDIDIQRYHFMSLILGAKNVSLIYLKNDSETKSRFIEELIWQKQFKEKNLNVANIVEGVVINPKIKQTKSEYEKTDEIKKYLSDFKYSATSIDTYMKCKLQFYYKYVLRLSEQADYEDDYESMEVGNCIHAFLQEVFCKGFTHEQLMNPDFKKYYDEKLEKHLSQYFSNKQTGNIFLLKKLIKNRMDFFYENEIKRNFKEVLDVEFDADSTINVEGKDYKLKARIDRADINEDGTIHIIDYKTGKGDTPLYRKFIEDCDFTREIVAGNIKSFQLIIYKYLYEKKYGKDIDNCVIYSIKDCKIHPLLNEKNDKKTVFNSTIRQLKYIISEINSDEPFKSEIYDNVKCERCPYFYLCR
ncbi:MAG: PD-(D/E)XK nuclease family protein [Elusimicrobia bacterium]|nr:PD-(D/E)XK nuclease family protein [Elusimicrobiota bacterium]